VLAAAIGGQPLHPAILRASQTESTPADGGFLVTPSVASFIFSRAAESSIFMRIGARVEPMSSSELLVNALDDDDETGDAEANVTAGWTAEGEDQSAQTVKFRQVRLTAAKLTVLAAASNELVEDGGRAVVMALEDALGDAIGKRFDRSILTGTGAGMPLGLLNSPATVTVDKVSGQAASTFLWANAAAMWARLAPGSHERAWWLVHPSVLPQAVSMSLVIGTAGAIPPGSFEAGGPTGYRLLGRPVLVTSRVKALGASGDVILVDPTQIVVGIRRGLAIERSQHAYFSSDRLAIRARFRGDARPLWATPLVPVEGTDTLSPIVVLEDR
jgi:HK97 family phage major capsid protein